MQRGTSHTPEAIEKIRQAGIGRKQSEESNAKRSQTLKGRKLPPEQVARMRAAKTGMKYKKNKEVQP